MEEKPFSWREDAPAIIPPVACQVTKTCWSFSFIHQFEALLRLRGRLGEDQHLSVQELVNILPVRHRLEDGTIRGSIYARRSLTTLGTVLEEHCPLTHDLNTHGATPESPNVERFVLSNMETVFLGDYIRDDVTSGRVEFERDLYEDLKKRPVSARIPMCPSYLALGIYDPSVEEIGEANRRGHGHFLMLTGAVKVLTGEGTWVPCWQGKCSSGENFGDNGYVYIRRGKGHLTEYVIMEVE